MESSAEPNQSHITHLKKSHSFGDAVLAVMTSLKVAVTVTVTVAVEVEVEVEVKVKVTRSWYF